MNLFNLELEQQVLGAILLDNEVYHEVRPILSPEHFQEELHGGLYRIFGDRISTGRGVVRETIVNFIAEWPQMLEISAGEYLTNLVQNVAARSAIGPIAHELRDLAARRAIEGLAQVCYNEANDMDPARSVDDAVNSVEDAIIELRGHFRTRRQENSWAAALQGSIDSAAQAYQGEEDPGFPWFIPEMEAVVGERLQQGSLVGLLADSGGGKTSFAIQQIAYLAKQDIPVIFFSFEQTPRQVADQIFAQEIDLESRLWRRGKVTEAEFDNTVEFAKTIQRWPFEVHKMFGAKVSDMTSRARRFFRNRGNGLIVIDHAKRITPDNPRSNLADQVNQVYGDTKNMALETDAACLLLMQRNMEGMRRNNPRPMRSDIYGGGGAIENLDACVALWREVIWLKEQHPNLQSDEARYTNEQRQEALKFTAELIGLKARFYEQGISRKISWTPRFTRFGSIRREDNEPELI